MPEGFIYFVEPNIASIEAGLVKAVNDVIKNRQPSKEECHSVVRNTYNWFVAPLVSLWTCATNRTP